MMLKGKNLPPAGCVKLPGHAGRVHQALKRPPKHPLRSSLGAVTIAVRAKGMGMTHIPLWCGHDGHTLRSVRLAAGAEYS